MAGTHAIMPVEVRPCAAARRRARRAALVLSKRLVAISASLALMCLAAAPASGPVRFSERIAPLAEKRCDGCHAKAPGGPMAEYRNARSFVTPNKPDQSPYYALPKGHPQAWGDAADLVREWIASGAHE